MKKGGCSLFKSINQWSFPGGMALKECVALAKAEGFEAFEPAIAEEGELTLSSTPAQIKEIKKMIEGEGLKIASLAAGLYWNYPPSASDPDVRKKAVDCIRKQIEAANVLGAGAILVVPGVVGKGFGTYARFDRYDVAYDNALESVNAVTADAQAARVVVGLENVWNNFLVSPLEMRDFIDKIGSPFVGAYFDVGNMLPWGYPEHWIPILGKRIARVHVKDFKKSVGTLSGFVDLLAGDVDWVAVIRELKAIGYEGPLTAEMGGYKTHSGHVVRRTSLALDEILKG